MAPKILSIVGGNNVGKKTITGSLIYKCGLDLTQLGELEVNGVKTYREIALFYEKSNTGRMFYGPLNRFKVEKTSNPDAALWVVDATDSDRGKDSSDALVSLVSNHQLQPRELLVIVINKMDLVDWSEQVFLDFANTFSRVVEVMSARVRLVPVSALDGENVLENPLKFNWVKGLSTAGDGGKPGLVSNLPLIQVLP